MPIEYLEREPDNTASSGIEYLERTDGEVPTTSKTQYNSGFNPTSADHWGRAAEGLQVAAFGTPSNPMGTDMKGLEEAKAMFDNLGSGISNATKATAANTLDMVGGMLPVGEDNRQSMFGMSDSLNASIPENSIGKPVVDAITGLALLGIPSTRKVNAGYSDDIKVAPRANLGSGVDKLQTDITKQKAILANGESTSKDIVKATEKIKSMNDALENSPKLPIVKAVSKIPMVGPQLEKVWNKTVGKYIDVPLSYVNDAAAQRRFIKIKDDLVKAGYTEEKATVHAVKRMEGENPTNAAVDKLFPKPVKNVPVSSTKQLFPNVEPVVKAKKSFGKKKPSPKKDIEYLERDVQPEIKTEPIPDKPLTKTEESLFTDETGSIYDKQGNLIEAKYYDAVKKEAMLTSDDVPPSPWDTQPVHMYKTSGSPFDMPPEVAKKAGIKPETIDFIQSSEQSDLAQKLGTKPWERDTKEYLKMSAAERKIVDTENTKLGTERQKTNISTLLNLQDKLEVGIPDEKVITHLLKTTNLTEKQIKSAISRVKKNPDKAGGEAVQKYKSAISELLGMEL